MEDERKKSMASKMSAAIAGSGSHVCVGLDPDPARMPITDIFEFNRAIIDATSDLTAAYKPQIAFYEALGMAGMEALGKTIRYIREAAPGVFVILDAKRGDIGHVAAAYARAMFKVWDCDAVTVYAYQGSDTLKPFLEHEGRGIFVVCRTSNPSAREIQDISSGLDGETVYDTVARYSESLGDGESVGLVVGATYPEELERIRSRHPTVPILIPGVGAQGGDAAQTAELGKEMFLINSSRGIIFASNDPLNFDVAARTAVMQLRDEIALGLEAA